MKSAILRTPGPLLDSAFTFAPVVIFGLDQANEALLGLKEDRLSGPAVILPNRP